MEQTKLKLELDSSVNKEHAGTSFEIDEKKIIDITRKLVFA